MDEPNEPNLLDGCIYKLTCTKTNMLYIGQAMMYILNDDNIVEYGAKGRFVKHVSDAKCRDSRNTPLMEAMREHGSESFTVEEIDYADINRLDILETEYIEKFNTVFPNGYNVASHGRKVGVSQEAAEYFASRSEKVVIHIAQRYDKPKIVLLIVTFKSKKVHKFSFGAGIKTTYFEAVDQSIQFLDPFVKANIPISVSDTALALKDPLAKYNKQFGEISLMNVRRVLISTTSVRERRDIIIFLYIKDTKTPKRVTFSTLVYGAEKAHDLAKEFVTKLNLDPSIEVADKV